MSDDSNSPHNISVRVRRLPNAGNLPLPRYHSAGASGLDLQAALYGQSDITLNPGQMQMVGTGIALSVPIGFEAQVRGRSGLAREFRISVEQGVGTIDSDYTGEVLVLLKNDGIEAVNIVHGNRIAQLVIAPVMRAELIEEETLEETGRGSAGFGSTGST